MIVVMKTGASAKDVAHVINRIEADGYAAHLSEGDHHTIIGVVGESPTPLLEENYDTMLDRSQVVHRHCSLIRVIKN